MIRQKLILFLIAWASTFATRALAFCVIEQPDSIPTEVECPEVWPSSLGRNIQPWTQNLSSPWQATSGLSGRHLCVWASHGRYYKQGRGWTWQRPSIYCTIEDLLTPSFVYPFLIPMLENAGAVVWTPRERDMQTHMVLADHPTQDTSRQYVWQMQIPEAGQYAVYVRYPYLSDAVPDAQYTINHGGERTRIAVNQRMGADTWVYLGTYGFNPAERRDGRIELNKNTTYRGRVAAGEVRIGGGMGHITRSTIADSLSVPTSSGLPHYLEAARYYAQWAGLPDSLYNTENDIDDYKDDLRTRSNFLNWLADGSCFSPHESPTTYTCTEGDSTFQQTYYPIVNRRGGSVPFELSLAVHTDAGYRTDSIPFGTLAISTTVDGLNRHNYSDLISRRASLNLSQKIVAQTEQDLCGRYGWHQREVRDRNYSETRSPRVPSAIVEMLSHQNFLDARFAHDPEFKFLMSRAIYKAILRYIYDSHQMTSPVVQPLRVRDFTATVDGTDVRLSWHTTPDTLEPTARPDRFILYTRVNDGDFDNGQSVNDSTLLLHITPGVRYTYKVVASNAGGISFPSNLLTVYAPPSSQSSHRPSHSQSILLVDAFTRLSGPAYIETTDSIGFLLNQDPGVPWGHTMEYCGQQVCFDPTTIGMEGPGTLGYSSTELEGQTITGNTFDICSRAAAALVARDSTVTISSISVSALPSLTRRILVSSPHVYYLAGLQGRFPHNMADYPVYPQQVRSIISQHLANGGTMTIEGRYTSPDRLSEDERAWWNTLSLDFSQFKPSVPLLLE